MAQFVSTLRELAKHCDYSGLEDGPIVDQLIERTSCTQLRERLLLEPDSMTLADAVMLGKQFETAIVLARRFSRAVLELVTSSPLAVQNVGQEMAGLVRTATVLLCKGQNPHLTSSLVTYLWKLQLTLCWAMATPLSPPWGSSTFLCCTSTDAPMTPSFILHSKGLTSWV